MRTSTALLAALAVLLVTPSCLGRPNTSCKKSRSSESATFSAAEASSSEQEIKAANGVYQKSSKESESKAVAASAQKSSESIVSENNGAGSYVRAQKSSKSSSSTAFSSSSSSEQKIITSGNCGCTSKGARSIETEELTEEKIKTIYAQQKGETLEAYYKRIVSKTKYTSSVDSYVRVLNIVRKHFYKLNIWYDTKYIDLVKEYYTAVYKKTSSEAEDVYYSRIIKKEAWESEVEYARRVIMVRNLFPHLPLWTEESFFEKYTKSLYSMVYKKLECESEEAYIQRIFAKDRFFDKSDEIWAKRLFIIQEATISNSIWYEEKYFQYTKNFYSMYYKKVEKETSDVWLTRVLKPLPGESVEQSIKRISLIKKVTESSGCWKYEYFKKVQTTKTFQTEYLSQIQRTFFELTEADIKTIYTQQEGETTESYYKRIVSKTEYTSTTDSYIKTLNIARKYFYKLDLWYDTKYIGLVKEYYKAIYTKTSSESEDVYYSRIIKKEAWESEVQYAKRVIVIRNLFPSLPLWSQDTYFEKYTKSIYSVVYKKLECESEEAYIQRIFAKDLLFDTSDEIWAKRLFYVQQVTISSSIWYEEKYLSYLRNFYSVFYKTLKGETSTAWLTRVLKPLPGESFEVAIKRIRIIKQVTADCSFWTVEVFKSVRETKCYEDEYFSLIEKEFFATEGYYKSVKSSRSVASSSFSSSSSEQSLKANTCTGEIVKKSSSSEEAASAAAESESSESVEVGSC